jgi:hypothetical protein
MSNAIGIEIGEPTRAIWFVTMPAAPGDWMACLNALENGRFHLTYRFRYYHDKDVWDSKDKKNWYSGETDDLEKGIAVVRLVAESVKENGLGEVTELLRGNLTARDFMRLLMAQPFAHTKKMSLTEYEAEYGARK